MLVHATSVTMTSRVLLVIADGQCGDVGVVQTHIRQRETGAHARRRRAGKGGITAVNRNRCGRPHWQAVTASFLYQLDLMG